MRSVTKHLTFTYRGNNDTLHYIDIFVVFLCDK